MHSGRSGTQPKPAGTDLSKTAAQVKQFQVVMRAYAYLKEQRPHTEPSQKLKVDTK